MSKKKGLFSWLGLGGQKKEKQEEARLEAEKLAAEQAASEQAEAERLAAEQAAAEKAEAEQAEAERLAAEQAAAEQAAAEQAEAERLAAEQAAAEKAAAEQAEAERLAAEQAAAEKAAAEQAEAERLAAEQAAAEKAAAEQAEAERLAAEQAAAERAAAEQAEAERLAAEQAAAEQAEAEKAKAEPKKAGFFTRLKQSLTKTRQNIGGGIFDLFRGKKIDDELFEELETHLLLADVGVDTTTKIIDSLTESASRSQLKDAEALYDLLKQELKKVIEPVNQPLEIPDTEGPYVILMVGVNGVGKTTTIGKLAKQFQAQGKSVMLAAGDTFRAAAVEQLQVWGERNDIPVIAQHTGADSASVIFDAISAAKARGADILIADTAGRLQNKNHLMEELKKVVRVMKKQDVNAPHEVMLTLDAGTGQNALSQASLFDQAVGLTGLTLTKLDGTAKGGVVFAIADKFALPIRYLGVGEGIDDLRPFNGDDFINALFEK
ncbi:signal recognition particle-docking protein FtsY [Thalassomonas viridans]|uniref:Signal recognition particle receptor FtsY n=1 Tax=Thalassomonas viridans TaxID=137584 RepID=A0AAE9Z375_9GAMM|nr:signal recognition particle-docking protein FtsY [Thalassomonas viridans]WDE05467.1 signal recognition particle-docking protein FtsY [Thalassomonas viridans]